MSVNPRRETGSAGSVNIVVGSEEFAEVRSIKAHAARIDEQSSERKSPGENAGVRQAVLPARRPEQEIVWHLRASKWMADTGERLAMLGRAF